MSLSSPSLSDLGWDDQYAAALADPGLAQGRALRPGRVVRRDRGSALVATGDVVGAHAVSGFETVTGDWVALDGDRIVAILPRRGVMRRRAPDGTEQLLAANVDIVALVCGIDRPVRPGRIHRGVVQAWDAGAGAVVVLTKMDLAPDPEALAAKLARDVTGVDVVLVSSTAGRGLDDVRAMLAGRTAALLGESGAGKSSLLNALAGREVAPTGPVRKGDAKGRHTTARRELHVIPGAGRIIDTPGLRAFGLAAPGSAVEAAFDDIDELAEACRFRDCRHDGEPGCAVLAAVESGDLSADRLHQQRRLQREVASELLRSSSHDRRLAERRFARVVRDVQRLKRRGD